MAVIRVQILCDRCRKTFVSVVIPLDLLDPFTVKVRGSSFIKFCARCKATFAGEGANKYGHHLSSRVDNAAQEIRDNIIKTQVKRYSKEEIAALEPLLRKPAAGEGRMECCFGRNCFDPEHATCKGCREKALVSCPFAEKKRAPRSKGILASPVAAPNNPYGYGLLCFVKLETPNKWTNKHRGHFLYRNERDKWYRIFRTHLLPLYGPHNERKRHLEVVRYCPSHHSLIRDVTNQEGAFKPLEDAMTMVGVIKDDRENCFVREPLKQEVTDLYRGPATLVLLKDL